MPSLSSFEDMIGFHMIPINKYNLIDLSNKLLSNLYPLDGIFESSFLREYGTSIAVMSSNINDQIHNSAIQIEYTNAVIKYTAITILLNMTIMGITDIIFSAIIANIDSILSRIALEGTLNVLNGFISAFAVELIAQKESNFYDENRLNQASISGVLGGLFGFSIFTLHNSILNGIDKLISPVSNISASIETSVATSATMSKISNTSFNPGEAAISGAAMGLFAGAHGIYNIFRMDNVTHENIELDNIGNNISEDQIREIYRDSSILDKIKIQNNKNLYIGDINNPRYHLSNRLPVLNNIRFISSPHEEGHLSEFIDKFTLYNNETYNNEIIVFNSCGSSEFINQIINKDIPNFVLCRGDMIQTGKHIIGDFHYYSKVYQGYRHRSLGNDLIKGLANISPAAERDNIISKFDNAYQKWYYKPRKWGDSDNKIPNIEDLRKTGEVGEFTHYINDQDNNTYISHPAINDGIPMRSGLNDNNNIIPNELVAINNKTLDMRFYSESFDNKINTNIIQDNALGVIENKLDDSAYIYVNKINSHSFLNHNDIEIANNKRKYIQENDNDHILAKYLKIDIVDPEYNYEIIRNITDRLLHEDIVNFLLSKSKMFTENITDKDIEEFMNLYINLNKKDLGNLYKLISDYGDLFIDIIDFNIIDDIPKDINCDSLIKMLFYVDIHTPNKGYQLLDLLLDDNNINIESMLYRINDDVTWEILLNNIDRECIDIVFNTLTHPQSGELEEEYTNYRGNNSIYSNKPIFNILRNINQNPDIFNKLSDIAFKEFVLSFKDDDPEIFIRLFVSNDINNNNKLIFNPSLFKLNKVDNIISTVFEGNIRQWNDGNIGNILTTASENYKIETASGLVNGEYDKVNNYRYQLNEDGKLLIYDYVLKDLFEFGNIENNSIVDIIFNNIPLHEVSSKTLTTIINKLSHAYINDNNMHYKKIFKLIKNSNQRSILFNIMPSSSFRSFVRTFKNDDYEQFIRLFINNNQTVQGNLWGLDANDNHSTGLYNYVLYNIKLNNITFYNRFRSMLSDNERSRLDERI